MTAYTAFGDSITAGNHATTQANQYTDKLAAYESWTLTNKGTSGARINDPGIIDQIYATTVTDADNYTLLTGTNDMRTAGTDINYQMSYSLNLQAALAWLAIPDAYKTRATSASTTGTWTNNSASIYGGIGRKSTTNGSTLTFSARGSTIYVGFIAIGSGSGAGEFAVSVDFVNKGNFSSRASVPARSDSAGAYGAALIRIPNLMDVDHTVTITVTSPTNIANEVYIDWVSGNAFPKAITGPNIWVGNCIQATAAGYTSYGGSNTAVGQFNNRIAEATANLINDGLNICQVNAVDALDYTVDMYTDGLHPDDSGHDKLFNVFATAISSTLRPHDRSAGYKEHGKWIPVTYQNSWVDFGGAWPGASYMKDSSGYINLRGMVKSGTIGNVPIFTLPIGFRPSVLMSTAVRSGNAFGYSEIYPSGEVRATSGSNGHFCLDNIRFLAEA